MDGAWAELDGGLNTLHGSRERGAAIYWRVDLQKNDPVELQRCCTATPSLWWCSGLRCQRSLLYFVSSFIFPPKLRLALLCSPPP